MKSKYKQYLGDGLYADYDGEHIVLTAENGIETSDTVYLNREVFEELLSYEKRLRGESDEEAGS